MSNTQDRAIATGQRLARQVFAKRGNHSEAHLSELELAALLALAATLAEKATPEVRCSVEGPTPCENMATGPDGACDECRDMEREADEAGYWNDPFRFDPFEAGTK